MDAVNPEFQALIDAQDALLTSEQRLTCEIGNIRAYADAKGLTGEQVRLIFEAGMAATFRLRPDILPPHMAGLVEG